MRFGRLLMRHQGPADLGPQVGSLPLFAETRRHVRHFAPEPQLAAASVANLGMLARVGQQFRYRQCALQVFAIERHARLSVNNRFNSRLASNSHFLEVPSGISRMAATSEWRKPSTSNRSEEHTSELQSPCNLVCRLLLEKKNTLHSRWQGRCCMLSRHHSNCTDDN